MFRKKKSNGLKVRPSQLCVVDMEDEADKNKNHLLFKDARDERSHQIRAMVLATIVAVGASGFGIHNCAKKAKEQQRQEESERTRQERARERDCQERPYLCRESQY